MDLENKRTGMLREDVQPKPTSAGYRATWHEQGMEVSACLVPEACAPSLGFVLEISCHHEPDPGQTRAGQPQQASACFSRIQRQTREVLIAAGWLVVGRLGSPPHEVWQHQDRLWGQRSVQERQDLFAQLASIGAQPTSEAAAGNQPIDQVTQESSQPPSKVYVVYGDKEARERARESGAPPAYSRWVKARIIPFSCARCGTQTQVPCYPGAKPQYCESCVVIVRREHTRTRVQKFRDKKRAQQTEF